MSTTKCTASKTLFILTRLHLTFPPALIIISSIGNQSIGCLIVKLATNTSTMYFDAFEKLAFITKHEAIAKSAIQNKSSPLNWSVYEYHPYIFTKKGNCSGGSFFSQVNAESPAAPAHAQEERMHYDFQQDAPQSLRPACGDENTLDAWTNHPDVKDRESQ